MRGMLTTKGRLGGFEGDKPVCITAVMVHS